MDSIETLSAESFPILLSEITDPPKKLYLKGEFPVAEKYLTVVGTRKPSSYGKDAVKTLLAGLRGLPVAVISGLALGTDALAHEAALENGIPTVAVPGSGLSDKVLYPAANRELAKRILKAGGCLLSEFEPDFKATDYSFPQRNRIMAGLSHATLVIEAQIKSGTLITSKFATEYNRDVLAVPGSIFSSLSEGPHMLIRLGATPITTPEELRQALGFAGEKIETKKIAFGELSQEEKKVVEMLSSPVTRDEIIDALGMPVSAAQTLLGAMEIKGIIVEQSGEIRLA